MSAQTLLNLVKQMEATRELVEGMKGDLEIAQANLLRLEREDIPECMNELGLAQVTLSNGTTVSLQVDVATSITADHRSAAVTWLVDNDYGGIVKTVVEVELERGNVEQARKLAGKLAKTYPDVALIEKVHPSTLKAFVKECLRDGVAIPFDLFSIHPFNKAILKKGK